MYKRPLKKDENSQRHLKEQERLKIRAAKKHPIQQIVSTLPQLAISAAILFFVSTTFNVSLNNLRGYTFNIASLAGIVICSVFVILQLKGTEYKNWQEDATTRQYIQIASISSVISFFGFNISLWTIFGILTPIIIITSFVFVLSILIISTAFFSK